jgi:signal transduction histidine kinase
MKLDSNSKPDYEIVDFLKRVSLFANLPDEDLSRLRAVVKEEFISANKLIFTEGDVGDKAYVIVEGEIDILKGSGGQAILLATRRSGEVIGEMSLLEQAPRSATGRTRTDCKLLSLSHEGLSHVLDISPSVARAMLAIITDRLRNTEMVLHQSEKMAQLGTLTAGIAHELNNPASAVQQGSRHLDSTIENLQAIYQSFCTLGISNEQWVAIAEYQKYAHEQAGKPPDLGSLALSDREEVIESWLYENQIKEGWNYAPVLASLGFGPADLEKLKSTFPGLKMPAVLQWLCVSFTVFNLLAEINQGTTRIGDTVKSLKSYVYLDQGAVQSVDIHEGLDNTLILLRSVIGTDVDVKRDYALNLPRIQAYGGELNQVWTNIIDNAIDAMSGKGKLAIKTSLDNDRVCVEIQDSGPGIPEDVQRMLFSPFFTTKPLGKGTGLGLNISFNIIQKHNGQISVNSRPGETRFSVRIPLNFNEVGRGSIPGQITDLFPVEDS